MNSLNFEKALGDNYVLLLNQPIEDAVQFQSVWQNAVLRVCADGGLNHLMRFIEMQKVEVEKLMPHVLIGDLDSVTEDNLAKARNFNVKIVRVEDQDTTDFQKAINYITKSHVDSTKLNNILVLGAVGGDRFDHTLASLSVLHEYADYPLWLVTPHFSIALINEGITEISCRVGTVCGIVPIAAKAIVTLSGFEYDLEGGEMQMGRLISTSNKTVRSSVCIKTDQPLIWTQQI